MGYKCPKCGYERQPADLASQDECPNCGVIYEKAEKALNELKKEEQKKTEQKQENNEEKVPKSEVLKNKKSNQQNEHKSQGANFSSSEREQKLKSTKCPFCKEDVSIDATVCPHCQKHIGLFILAERDPSSIIFGIVFAIIGTIASYLIHTDFIRAGLSGFSKDPGCCLCLTMPILFGVFFLIGLYAIGGFFIGLIIGKAYKKNE